MSRTYKYPRESLGNSITRDEPEADADIKKRLKKLKQKRKRKAKTTLLFMKLIAFRDQQRAKM